MTFDMFSPVVGFQWDDGNWPKCAKHGLQRREIEEVLTGQIAVLPDRSLDLPEVRFNAVGLTKGGRHVFVVFTLRPLGDEQWIRPISARFMHAREIKHYEQHTRDQDFSGLRDRR